MLEISDDGFLFSAALLVLYASAAFNVLSLQFIVVPYGGRHGRPGWGPTIPPPLAWFVMESPTLWVTLLLYPLGRHRAHPLSLLTISLYLIHYAHRTIIYPLRLLILTRSRTRKKTQQGFPVSIALTAFVFNLLNAYLQTRSVSHYVGYEESGAWIWVRVLVGLGIFAWGMGVNVRSDLALEQLKREGGGGYRIPRGGWFEWVCSPNYMGEAAEWMGWAVLAWSPAALCFFLYTCSNLVPRARAHLMWYREKFGDEYPKSRKAIVPLLY